MGMFDNIIKIVFKGDSKSAVTASKKVNKSLKDTEKQTKQVKKAFASLGKLIGVSFGILAIRQIGRVTFQLAKLGAQVDTLNSSFKLMAEKRGADSVAVMNEMSKAAGGLMSQTQLLITANRSMALGIPIDKMGELIEVSRKAARVLGTDVGFMVESLSVGLGRQSRLMLDNLGIILSVEEANKKYAASIGKTVKALTDQERRMAFINTGLEKAAETFSNIDLSVDSASDSLQQLETQWQRMKEGMGALILPVVLNITSALTGGGFDKLTDEQLATLIKEGGTRHIDRMLAKAEVASREETTRNKAMSVNPFTASGASTSTTPTGGSGGLAGLTPGLSFRNLTGRWSGITRPGGVYEESIEGLEEATKAALFFEGTMLSVINNIDLGFAQMFKSVVRQLTTGIFTKLIGMAATALFPGVGTAAAAAVGAIGGGFVGPPVPGGGGPQAFGGPGMTVIQNFPYGLGTNEYQAGRRMAQAIEKGTNPKFSTSL